jgi:hypothetical protein
MRVKNIVFCIPLLTITVVLPILSFSQENWQFNSKKEGIEVYTMLPANSSFKAIKTALTVDASLSKLAYVLMDVEKTGDWVYQSKNCKTLKQYSPSDVIYYSEVIVPWPFNNRDFAIRITLTQDKATKIITVIAENKPDFLPQKPGLVRIQSSNGKWVITPLANGKTRIEYLLQVDPGGNIPAWLVNLFATKGPYESFKGLREQVKKKEYDGKHLTGIKD